ncbi:MAG: alpha/beta fold hydrolase [Thermonemataceae bacterium]|nr:alpha/beta fold hydrolase [Thermonemataceae bacterium]
MNKFLNFLVVFAVLITNTACSQQQSFNQPIKRIDDVFIDSVKFEAYEGFVDVPENYEDIGSKRIQLPVLIIKSSNKNPQEPIFWFDGGPGGTNIVSQSKINLPSAANALKNHDFVCVGYRGVDGSVKLESKKITKAFKGLNNKMLSDKSIQNIKEKIKDYKKELKEENIDLNNYNILHVIEDMETVRKQLGYKKINILSVSYGTRVALLYSYKYPEIINRTLMIGATPPKYFLARPEQAEEVIEKYDQIYKAQTGTDFSIKETMKKAFEKMPKRWSVFRLDADKIKAGTINALYNVGFAVSVFDAYKKAVYENDYSGLFMLQKLSDVSHPKIMGDVYAKTVSADWENDKNYEKEIRNSQTILGGNVSLLYAATSEEWEIKPIPAIYQKCQKSNNETLIISGSLDHRTPPSIVDKELMPFLTNAKHIILKNSSHIDILSIVMKNEMLLQEYFDHGKVDETKILVPEKVDFTPKIKMSKLKIFLFGLIK